MKRTRGFSLIELIVGLAIFGVLFALGLPGYKDWMQGTQVRNAAEAIQNGLQLARIEALRRNARVTFWLVSEPDPRVMSSSCTNSASGGSWVVSMDSPAGACATTPSDSVSPRIVQSHAAGDGNRSVTVAAKDSGNTAAYCVTFNGFGQAQTSCTNGTNSLSRVTFSSSQSTSTAIRNLEVRITAAGAVRMCDPTVTATDDPRKC